MDHVVNSESVVLPLDLPAMLRPPETLYLLRAGIAMQAGDPAMLSNFIIFTKKF